MKQNNWATRLATLGPLGYLPAPGTVGSFVAVLVGMLVSQQIWFGAFFIFFFCASWTIIFHALQKTDHPDPQQIIIDECVGMFIPFFFISGTLLSVISSFLLFRFFDITKWCGVSFFENCPGPCGVLLDDCAAGLLTGGVLWCITYLVL